MAVKVMRIKSEEIMFREGSESVNLHGIYFPDRSAQSVVIEAIEVMEQNTNFYNDFREFLIPDPSLSEGELFMFLIVMLFVVLLDILLLDLS